MRIHVGAAVAVIVAGVWLQINSLEWIVVLACCGVVMALECVNTAIERLANRLTQQSDDLIRAAKDASAGAVLITAITSAVIGGIIFLPKLTALLLRF